MELAAEKRRHYVTTQRHAIGDVNRLLRQEDFMLNPGKSKASCTVVGRLLVHLWRALDQLNKILTKPDSGYFLQSVEGLYTKTQPDSLSLKKVH